ncbi:Cysteine-rich RLK 29, putative isoform 1 [Hibiscus syriacus]|uniref:Cysteine-rich RLK 29, putative isoform 1 n=1 Tax=Hibiscus syriacus TaxID=106335 RepID=A0A6A2X125_HIBSY|nr:Cysteine-rich RLK 29, putative isoform 1 [Hibiscus syriacus]
MCVADDPAVRPTMSSVILMLGSKSISSPPPSTLPYSAARFVSMSDQPSSIGTGTGFLTSDQFLVGFLYHRRRRRFKGNFPSHFQEGLIPQTPDLMELGINLSDEDQDDEMLQFDLATIHAAKNNFSEENKLEEGGFGPDYKGKITNGKVIAVKRLSMRSRQGLGEFKNEVKLIVKLQHKNLVRLLGYCLKKDEMIIVYKFMANTSLDTFLSEQGILPLPGRSEVLVTYAWMVWNEGRGDELIDPNITDDCPVSEVVIWIHIALLCVQDDPAVRATMSSVILMLKSKSINLPQPSTLPYSAARFVTMSDQSSSIGTGTGFLASDQSITSGSSLLERSKNREIQFEP